MSELEKIEGRRSAPHPHRLATTAWPASLGAPTLATHPSQGTPDHSHSPRAGPNNAVHVVPGKFATVPTPQFGNRFGFGSISVRFRFDFGSNSVRIRFEIDSNSVRNRFEFGCRFEIGSKSVQNRFEIGCSVRNRFEIGSNSVRIRFEFGSKSVRNRFEIGDFELILNRF